MSLLTCEGGGADPGIELPDDEDLTPGSGDGVYDCRLLITFSVLTPFKLVMLFMLFKL